MGGRHRLYGALGLGFAAMLFLGVATAGARTVQPQQQFFRCPTGYNFAVHSTGTAARCVDTTPAQTANYTCTPGQVKIVDQSGPTDACMSTIDNTIAVYNCPTGYNRIRRPGPDICEKPAVTTVKPVNVAIVL
jgi:hypothetical protein